MATKEDVIRKVNAAWPNMTGSDKEAIISSTGKGFTSIEGALNEENLDHVNNMINWITDVKK